MMLAMALARCLEVLGEAASKVTPEFGCGFQAFLSRRSYQCGTT
jgi:uncharacterized protein with HEPN domain